MNGLWYVLGFAGAGVSFVFLTIGIAWLISHRTRGSRGKQVPYESGIDTYGDTHGRFGLSFYLSTHSSSSPSMLRSSSSTSGRSTSRCS